MGESMAHYSFHLTQMPARSGGRAGSNASRSSHATDSALLEALREGHREFLRCVNRYTKNTREGERLLHEFYREALKTAATPGIGEGLKGALIQTMRRALAGYQHRAGTAGTAKPDLCGLDGPKPMFLDEVQRAVNGCLYRILPTLPRDSSWLIWQADLLGQPFGRLAVTLGISIDSVAMRMARARRAAYDVLQHLSASCPTHGYLNCTFAQAQEPAESLGATTPAPVPGFEVKEACEEA
jgi:DNA-directed RNA polymerase specialized sigma24 family protein